jgi:putative ATPase
MAASSPLADRARPAKLEEIVGQAHILGEGKVLYNLLVRGEAVNMIFYGPSGVGKTTVANLLSRACGKTLYRLNATNASVADIKQIAKEAAARSGAIGEPGALLYLDEIQNFNKKQQQSLLEHIENGSITLIAATTENPYFYVYNAILSRCSVFEFKPVPPKEIEKAVLRASDALASDLGLEIEIEDHALAYFAHTAGGDVRKALNALELCARAASATAQKLAITEALCEDCVGKRAFRYDRDGDAHYDVLSAFQKSVRGSDPDAAVHYLARLVVGGDLPSICRRLLVMAAEDVGLAFPQAVVVTKACVDAALQLGFPEARIPLAEAVLLLATAPKSNSAVCAIDAAAADIEAGRSGEIPAHLKDSHYGGAEKLGRGIGYQYPHGFENNYVRQQYLPDALKNKAYYEYGKNKTEQAAKRYWDEIKGDGSK